MNARLRTLLPPAVIVLGIVLAVVMIKSRQPAPRRPVETSPPLVRVIPVETTDHTFQVRSQGTVTPRTEITMVSEVSGRVIEVAPNFAPGGFFAEGELLLRIDPLDYEAAVEQARVALAQAERRLAEEEAASDIARREWDRIGTGEATPLTLREPQLAEARAQVASAGKSLELVRRDLDRTRIRAPYTGRVREQRVDLGQYVTRGTPVAVLYAVDYAEVRLPLPGDDLAYVDLPLGRSTTDGPVVVLEADLAGHRESWNGTIVRTEGEIDPRTRLVVAVARIEDPYRRSGTSPVPLAAGLFVDATIVGRTVNGVMVLPRAALRGADQVLVVDPEDRIRIRTVEVLRAEENQVIIASGLEPGERVSVSPLDVVVDGMPVRTIRADAVDGNPDGKTSS